MLKSGLTRGRPRAFRALGLALVVVALAFAMAPPAGAHILSAGTAVRLAWQVQERHYAEPGEWYGIDGCQLLGTGRHRHVRRCIIWTWYRRSARYCDAYVRVTLRGSYAWATRPYESDCGYDDEFVVPRGARYKHEWYWVP